MQKKLIALAIAGLSGAAFAQSNVTVYGQMNMAYENYSSSPSATTKNVSKITSADSRLGFKGEEALGNGLKTVFTAEFRINADSSGNQYGTDATTAGTSGLGLNARQTFVGLSGSWGTLTAGRQYTPYFDAAAAIDPFGASTSNVASTATLHPLAAVARANNSVKYVGAFPVGSGTFVVAGLVGLGEANTNRTDATGLSGGSAGTVTVGAGPGFAVTGTAATTAATTGAGQDNKIESWELAYAQGGLLVGAVGIKLKDNAAGILAATGVDTKGTAFGGTYDFGVAKAAYLYDAVKVDGVLGKLVDYTVQTIGVTVPLGAHTIKAQYSSLNDKQNMNMDGKHTGIAYNYAMSKRTTLFANYGHVSSSNNANYGLLPAITAPNAASGTASFAAGTGYQTGYQLGLAHSF